MTYFRLLFLLIISLNANAFAKDSEFKPFFNSSTFLYSEPVSLKTIRNDWKGKYWDGGEKQIGKFRTELGVTKGKWSIAGIYREDYYSNFSSDTADLYHSVENNLNIDRTAPYTLSLDAYRFRGKGLQIKRAFEFSPTLSGNIGVNIFKASNLLDGKLKGQAQSISSDSYDFQINVDSQYSEDPLFDRTLDSSTSGKGLAVDADITWQATPKLNFSIKATDIAGFIRWDNVPYTSSNANSNNAIINDSGFTQVTPLLTGIEGYNSHYTQSLKPAAEATLSYDIKEFAYTANMTLKHFDGLDLFGVGLKKRNALGDLSLNIWPSVNTAEINFTHRRFGFSLGLDDIDIDDTRTAWLSFTYVTD